MNVFLCVFGLTLGLASADLSVAKTKPCRELTCEPHHFCSVIDGSCKHCSRICDEGHNQQIQKCNEDCQDYIHDKRYLLKQENVATSNDKELQKLQVLSTISLIVSLTVFFCLVFLILTLWLNKKANSNKFNIFKLMSQSKKKNNEKADITRKGVCEISTIPDVRLNLQDVQENIRNDPRSPQMDFSTLTTTFKNYHARSEPDSVSSVCTNKSGKTVQPLAVRLPSEDSTLDFMYDNPALAPSPTLEKESSETRRINSNGT